ncbi:hypothetical protein BJV82DRAFT_614627 [Fennellomyces sp. T-0311]|nr:hypothetical protein BJV82DRAFT_614627 [Fennellomyces sp. T-0311]
MRVAVETLKPLPFYKCWYLFQESDQSTVDDLRKSLNREFQLAKRSSHLKLMAGGFEYLPRFKLKDYILENDLVIIGSHREDPQQAASEAVKSAQDDKQRAKDEKKRVKEDKKRAKEDKKHAKEVKRRAKEDEKQAKEQKRIEKKRKRAADDENKSVEAKKARPVKESGKLTKTQKRNARKRAARSRQREEEQATELEETVEDEAPVPEPVRKQEQEEQIAPPQRLLKQNKNKKANFLKEMGKKTRSHFHFEEEQQDYYDEEEQYTPEQDNAYGSAVVTSVEADETYTGEKRDYDSLPVVSFSGPFPVESDRLAIKMLEMTASYTPEISDWKEVKVLSFDQAQGVLTVEFLPGFLLTEHRGKFTLRDNNQAEEDEDEEPAEEVLEDQTKQLSQFDVADMRRL